MRRHCIPQKYRDFHIFLRGKIVRDVSGGRERALVCSPTFRKAYVQGTSEGRAPACGQAAQVDRATCPLAREYREATQECRGGRGDDPGAGGRAADGDTEGGVRDTWVSRVHFRHHG